MPSPSHTDGTARATAVIPAHEAGRFLRRTIESVLLQTVPVDCVVVDDASTDETADIAASYAPRVRVLTHTANRGVAAARNTGWRSASTTFVGFLDADDLWHPEKVERQLEALDADPRLGFVYTDMEVIDEDDQPLGRPAMLAPGTALRDSVLGEADGMGIGVAQSVLVRRTALEALGGFDERLSYLADHDVACRLLMRCEVARVPGAWTQYRRSAGQMSRDTTALRRDAAILTPKLFADEHLPADLRGRRRRTEANMLYSLASAGWQEHRAQSLRDLAGALQRDPSRTLSLIARSHLLRRALRVSPSP